MQAFESVVLPKIVIEHIKIIQIGRKKIRSLFGKVLPTFKTLKNTFQIIVIKISFQM
jgi:hypothetical protein